MISYTENKPVALYNSDKKELIGVFMTMNAAGRYLFPFASFNRTYQRVPDALRNRCGIRNSFLDCRVVVRVANKEQIATVENGVFRISDKYPEPAKDKLDGYKGSIYTKFPNQVK
jgi:hypothetical protein